MTNLIHVNFTDQYHSIFGRGTAIVSRGFLTPYFLKISLYCLPTRHKQRHTAQSGANRLVDPYRYINTTCYMLTTGFCITLNNLLISIRLSSSRETKRILIEMMQMSKRHTGTSGFSTVGGACGASPPSYDFFRNVPPSKPMPSMGCTPHLKMTPSPPSHLKNTSSLPLKSEAPFHEMIPRKKHNK